MYILEDLDILKLLVKFAVFLGVCGSVVMVVGAFFYFGTQGKDGQIINKKFGLFAHKKFLFGLSLYLLSWVVKFVLHWIDPSIPMFGPALMIYRMSGGELGYYDDSFMD